MGVHLCVGDAEGQDEADQADHHHGDGEDHEHKQHVGELILQLALNNSHASMSVDLHWWKTSIIDMTSTVQ